MTEQTALDFQQAERNRILEKHEQKPMVRWLEWRLWLLRREVSANDARAILEAEGIEVRDKRLFGALFPRSRWMPVGWTNVQGPGHARKIQTFTPKPGVTLDPVEQP